LRPTWAEVDLGAIRANTAAVQTRAEPAALMAVVKADGYGHGAGPVAAAALEAGATSLAVALVEEGVALRARGVRSPILVFAEADVDSVADALAADLELMVASPGAIAAIARSAGRGPRVHLKIDTGMHRAGAEIAHVVDLARQIDDAGLTLAGVWSHLATADEPEHPWSATQLDRLEQALTDLRAAGVSWERTHVANSAGALFHPRARFDVVRVGISLYGVAPNPGFDPGVELRPVLSLHSRVVSVRSIEPGESVSYGAHWTSAEATRIATVPIGYADGVPRRLGLVGGEVLVRGRRRPIRGVVTMDQLMIEVDDSVAVGDAVVLLGTQGRETIGAWDWAGPLDTIAYEILTGIGPRVPRRYR
jgi:alanine racemase